MAGFDVDDAGGEGDLTDRDSRRDSPTFSFELYPPRDAAAEVALRRELPVLAALRPEFISVTYGANGSSRDASIDVLRQLIDLGVDPMAHLTCVGSSFAQASRLIREFLDAGITRFLALRGDPPAGVAPEDMDLGDLGSAAELVQLIDRVQRERVPFVQHAVPGFPGARRIGRGEAVEIAVASFPNGHPRSRSRAQDLDTLLAKEAAGATLAISQVFFEADDYLGFVAEAREAGVTMRLLPGVLPVLSPARLHRVLELTGERTPLALLEALETASTPEAAAAIGIDTATRLSATLLEGGASGIHLYTFNRSTASVAILRELGLLDPVRTPA